jgi:hypothetical protein
MTAEKAMIPATSVIKPSSVSFASNCIGTSLRPAGVLRQGTASGVLFLLALSLGRGLFVAEPNNLSQKITIGGAFTIHYSQFTIS